MNELKILRKLYKDMCIANKEESMYMFSRKALSALLVADKKMAQLTKRSPDSLKVVVSRLPKSPKTGKPLLVKGG